MKLEQSFEVAAPLDKVWDALIDVQRVAPCLPGAEIHDEAEDGTYHGAFQVKLGPTTASYRGTLKMEEMDAAAHTATMRAHGTDKRGQGGAKALITSRLAPQGDGTKVDVVTDFTITGRLARFGRGGMIEDVSNRLMREFSSCLQASLTHDGQAGEGQAGAARERGVEEGPSATAQAAPGDTAPFAPGAQEPAPRAPGAAPHKAKPVSGIRLMLGVLWDRLRRLWAGLGRRFRRSR